MSQTEKSKTISEAEDEIEYICDSMGLDNTIESLAKVLLKKWDEHEFTQSRKGSILGASAVVLACRREEIPYTVRDIQGHARLEDESQKKFVSRAVKSMAKSLYNNADVEIPVSPTNPKDLAYRYAEEAIDMQLEVSTSDKRHKKDDDAELGYSTFVADVENREIDSVIEDVGDTAGKIIDLVMKTDPMVTNGLAPSSIGGAATWIASRLHGVRITQDTIAKVAGSNQISIRTHSSEFIETLIIDGGYDIFTEFASEGHKDTVLQTAVDRIKDKHEK